MMTARNALADQLDRWVRMQLISDEQARDILAAERVGAGPPAAPDGVGHQEISPVAEGLGYVGGMLVVVAAITITSRYWTAIGVAGRVGIATGAAVLLLAIGADVPQTSVAGARLRGVSWALSVVALGFGLGLLAADVLDLRGERVSLLAGGVCLGYAAVLWWRRRGVLQHGVLLAALAVTVASAAALLPGGDESVVGLAIWGVGLVWLLLGWGGLVGPWYAVDVCGGIAVVVGALFTVQAPWGGGPALATVVGLVAAGVVLRNLVLTAMGTIATLTIVPAVSERYFPDTLSAPLTLLAAGTLLVAIALYIARRGGRRAFGDRREGAPRTAARTAAVVAVAVAAAVVGLGVA